MNPNGTAGAGDRPRHLRDLPVFLRAPRGAALWLTGAGITVASVVAYVLSYAGLAQWALHHGWPGAGAIWFPFLIDLPLVVCEVILFVAAIDGDTPWRVRALAWMVLLAFTTASTVGNADHLATATPLTRGGFALPPLVLAIVLGFGLGELKRQAAKYRQPGARTVSPPSFTDAQTAALDALARTTEAGNPLSQNQLMAQFRLSRAEAREVRQKVALREENGNGQGPQDSDPDRQGPGRQARQDSGRRIEPEGRQGQVTPERGRGGPPHGTTVPAAHVPAGVAVTAMPPAPAGTQDTPAGVQSSGLSTAPAGVLNGARRP